MVYGGIRTPVHVIALQLISHEMIIYNDYNHIITISIDNLCGIINWYMGGIHTPVYLIVPNKLFQ